MDEKVYIAGSRRFFLFAAVVCLVIGVVLLTAAAKLPESPFVDNHCISKSTKLHEATTGSDLVDTSRQPSFGQPVDASPEYPFPPEKFVPAISLYVLSPFAVRPPPASLLGHRL